MRLVRERTAAGQSVRYIPFAGVSMLPMLRQGKDKVELSPLPEKLQKYDLPVYQLKSGKYVMHRITAAKDGYYICLGDNLTECETVYPEQMIALVTAFTRGDRRIEVTDPGYRLYCRLWLFWTPLRRSLWKFRGKLGRLKRRLLS